MTRQITLKSQQVEVAAPRELVFEVVASAGKTLEKTGNEKLVEFETRFRKQTIRTVEAVPLEPPTRIGYRWVEGRLDDVEEEIAFEARTPDLTVMSYSGWIGAGESLWDWAKTAFMVRRVFNRLVREHLLEGKHIAERRARRSRVHPRTPPAQKNS